MVIASGLVDVDDGDFEAAGGGAVHAPAEFTLVERVGRGVDADVDGGALLEEAALLFPKSPVIPGVIANSERNALAFEREELFFS